MFRLEEKDYDLNFVLRFDMLKEILIKLLKNQNNLQNEIDLLKTSNKERDNKIINIEQIITELQEESNRDESRIESKKEIEFEENQNVKNIVEEKELNNINNNIENKTQITAEIKENDIQQKENTEKNEENKKDLNNELNHNEKEKAIKKNVEDSVNKVEKKQKQEYISDKTDNKKNNEIIENIQTTPGGKSRSLFKKNNSKEKLVQIPLNIKELLSRINLLEIKLNNIYTNKDLKNLKQELKNHELENQSDLKVIEVKLDDINKKLEEYNKKIEDCELKCSSFDILNIVKDSGNGNVDAAKVLFKSLEDKCKKKFEIIDARYKQEALNSEKMKKNVENIVPKFDKINREITQLKELEEQKKEEIENTKKNIETQNENNSKLLKELDDELNKKLTELGQDFDKKIEEVETRLKSIKKVEEGSLFNLNLNDNENNKFDEEKFQMLEKKVNDLRTKLNDLNNTLRIFSNEEIQKIKNDVKELIYKIDTKIAKEDLKELYNMHLSDLDEINDLKEQVSLICEEQKKTSKDVQQTSSRLELLNSNVIMLQNSQLNGGRGPVIDITRYIDQTKLSETLKPIIKEIEKIYRELSATQREFSEIRNYEKIFEKKDRINRIEEEIYTKINDVENLHNRKFADKIDTNKALKALDLQIKDLLGERKRSEGGDNWLMAKQPLKCFNCASCEANIKNTGASNEYIPWNKYPQGERIYRMGQGFSHMLQMMTSEFVQTFEHNNEKDNKEINFSVENDSNANSKTVNKMYNSINNNTNNVFNINEKSLISARINNKDDFYRTGGKFKLPKMKKFSKFNKEKFDDTIPVTDEEKEKSGNSFDNGKINTESPKIMKIIKKKAKNPFSMSSMSGYTPKYGLSLDYGRKKNHNNNLELNMKDKIIKKNAN